MSDRQFHKNSSDMKNNKRDFNRDGGDKRNFGKRDDDTKRRKPDGGHSDNFRGRKQFSGQKSSSGQNISPRLGAFYLLEACLIDGRPLEFVEHRTLKQISPKDRGLTRMIAYTALRHNMELDALINEFVDEEIFTPQVNIFIKVGLTQILYMDVPDHAAVSETINAVFGKAFASKGMINAILRRGVEEGKEFLENHTDIINLPKYLWRSWVNTYGEKEARLILQAMQMQAPVDISVKSNPEDWAERLGGFILPTGGVRLGKVGRVTDLDGFDEGEWWVQDFAAQIPVELLGDVDGKTVVDMCCAPGGKTAQLLSRGAKVIAVDHNEYRLNRMRENMDRLGLGENLTIVLCDAVKFRVDEKVDAVLLDAPCSATGTIRKNPDLPYIKDMGLINSVAKLQRQMLSSATELVKDGGKIVFATCSLQPEEGEHHLSNLPENLKLAPVRRRELPGLEQAITPKGTIRTVPTIYGEDGGMDGFFVARFTKK